MKPKKFEVVFLTIVEGYHTQHRVFAGLELPHLLLVVSLKEVVDKAERCNERCRDVAFPPSVSRSVLAASAAGALKVAANIGSCSMQTSTTAGLFLIVAAPPTASGGSVLPGDDESIGAVRVGVSRHNAIQEGSHLVPWRVVLKDVGNEAQRETRLDVVALRLLVHCAAVATWWDIPRSILVPNLV